MSEKTLTAGLESLKNEEQEATVQQRMCDYLIYLTW